MVSLPPQFVATTYPGYFFNTENEVVYSLKIHGELKPVVWYNPNKGGPHQGFRISYTPFRHFTTRPVLTLDYLRSIPKGQDSVIGLRGETSPL